MFNIIKNVFLEFDEKDKEFDKIDRYNNFL